MKKFSLMVKSSIVSLALAFLVACTEKPTTQANNNETKPEATPVAEVITVGVDSAYPPYNFFG